jgi:hypothetical protein
MEVSQEFGTAARTGLVSGTANYIVDSYSINVIFDDRRFRAAGC